MRQVTRGARLARETTRQTHYRLETAVQRVQERLVGLPVLDARDPDELFGDDEHGVPRHHAMVIDTSALVAIMSNESSAPRLVAANERSAVPLVSAGTVIEASLVLLGRFGEHGELQLDALLRALKADLIAVDADQVAIARDAAQTFGHGRHRAALNFCDCFSYALALAHGEPLLFVGDNFSYTDVIAVAW